MYFCGMPIKRDRVNRVTGLVYLPIDSSNMVVGSTITLDTVEESDINCEVRDAMEMTNPKGGNAIGDAVFDAMSSVDEVLDVIGDSTESVIGYSKDGINFVLDTGRSIYTGGNVLNACDAQLLD